MTDAEGNEKVKDGTDDETVPSGWKLWKVPAILTWKDEMLDI